MRGAAAWIVVAVAVALAAGGCKKKQQPAAPSTSEPTSSITMTDGGPIEVVTPPALVTLDAGAVAGDLALAGAAAVSYEDPAYPVGDPTPQAVIAAVAGKIQAAAQAAGKPVPVYDPRLSAAANALASSDLKLLPEDSLEIVLSHAGNLHPRPGALMAWTSGDDASTLVDTLADDIVERTRADGFDAWGAGVGMRDGKGKTLLVFLQERKARVAPVPRQVAAGGRFTVRGEVLSPLRHPEVVVTSGGKVSSPAVARTGDSDFSSEIVCPEAPGAIRVEVVGDSPSGPHVAMNFPVWCGQAPPVSVARSGGFGQGGYRDFADAEQQVFALLNADRQAAGLPTLEWSEHAATVARVHSMDMRDHGFFAHTSPTSGASDDRAKAANLAFTTLRENIAKDYSAAGAEAGLMNSPGHRASILATDVKRVGVGVAIATDGSIYVTQLFVD